MSSERKRGDAGVQQLTEQARHDIPIQGEHPGDSAKPALENILISLRDTNKRTGIDAITWHAATRDERLFDSMILLLIDRNDDIRLTAAEALGNLGDIRAVEPLRQACTDENCFVRVVAREAIAKILCGHPEQSCR